MADEFSEMTDHGAEAVDLAEPLAEKVEAHEAPAVPAAEESGRAALEDYFIAQEDAGRQNSRADAEKRQTDGGSRQQAEPPDVAVRDENVLETNGEPAEEAKDFEPDDEAPADVPTLESLNEKYPRQNKKLLAETVEYAEAARKGREAIEGLGGESLLAPLGKISSGMRTGETREVFEGILEGAGENDLLRLVGDAAWLAFGHSRQMQETPESAALGRRLEALGDQIIAHRIGEGYTVQKLEMLKELDEVGWIDALDDWKDQGYVDPEQFFDLLEAEQDPEVFNRLRGEIREKDRQLEEVKIQRQRESEEQGRAADAEFIRSSGESIEKVLNETVWAKSVLREVKSDSRELAEEKAFLRRLLLGEAKKSFEGARGIGVLKSTHRNANDTPAYREAMTGAVNDAVLKTRDLTAVAERILSKLYAGTRNGTLTKPAAAAGRDLRPGTAPPTKTTEFSAHKPLSEKEIQRNLEEAFRERG